MSKQMFNRTSCIAFRMLCQHALLAPRPAAARRPSVSARRVATRAVELDGDTVTAAAAIVAGLAFGIGIPVLFAKSEQRDKCVRRRGGGAAGAGNVWPTQRSLAFGLRPSVRLQLHSRRSI